MNQSSAEAFGPLFFYDELQTTVFGRNLWAFKTLESTNSFLKKCPIETTPHGCVCLTDNQTAGRGQHQKVWISSPRKNLTFTIVIKPFDSDGIQLLPQVLALSVTDSIENMTGLIPELKWPNDILLNGKKICGVLSEGSFHGDKIDRTLLGMGINVNDSLETPKIKDIATSLRIESGKEVSREKLLAHICKQFEVNYELWKQKDLNLIRRINKKYPGLGKPNTIEINGIARQGLSTFLGLDSDGYPLFLDENHSVVKIQHQNIRFKLYG